MKLNVRTCFGMVFILALISVMNVVSVFAYPDAYVKQKYAMKGRVASKAKFSLEEILRKKTNRLDQISSRLDKITEKLNRQPNDHKLKNIKMRLEKRKTILTATIDRLNTQLKPLVSIEVKVTNNPADTTAVAELAAEDDKAQLVVNAQEASDPLEAQAVNEDLQEADMDLKAEGESAPQASEPPEVIQASPMEFIKRHSLVAQLEGSCYKIYTDLCVMPSRPPHCIVDDQDESASSIKLHLLKFHRMAKDGGAFIYQALGDTPAQTELAYKNSYASGSQNQREDILLYVTLTPAQCTAESSAIQTTP